MMTHKHKAELILRLIFLLQGLFVAAMIYRYAADKPFAEVTIKVCVACNKGK